MSDDEATHKAPSAPTKRERTPAQVAVFERLQAAIKEKRTCIASERAPAPPPAQPPSPPPPSAAPPPATKAPKATKRAHRAKKPLAEIVREAVEEESSDSGSDDEVSPSGPLRELYKNKYQEKYRQKYSARTTAALTKGVAHTALRSRVDDEMHRLARTAIFGS